MRPAIKRLIISGAVIVALGTVAIMLLTFSDPKVYMAPPPPPAPPSTLLAAIDRLLENLELANIAFNAPATLQAGSSAVVQLLLSTQKSIEELQDIITATGERGSPYTSFEPNGGSLVRIRLQNRGGHSRGPGCERNKCY